jgi:hypothetical protein
MLLVLVGATLVVAGATMMSFARAWETTDHLPSVWKPVILMGRTGRWVVVGLIGTSAMYVGVVLLFIGKWYAGIVGIVASYALSNLGLVCWTHLYLSKTAKAKGVGMDSGRFLREAFSRKEATGGIVRNQEELYAAHRRLKPYEDPHSLLAELWLSRVATYGPPRLDDETLVQLALTETFLFSCLPEGSNARALGLYLAHREEPKEFARLQMNDEYALLMKPIFELADSSELDPLYESRNPRTRDLGDTKGMRGRLGWPLGESDSHLRPPLACVPTVPYPGSNTVTAAQSTERQGADAADTVNPVPARGKWQEIPDRADAAVRRRGEPSDLDDSDQPQVNGTYEQEIKRRAAESRKNLGMPDDPESVRLSQRATALLMMYEQLSTTEDSTLPDS